MGECQECGNFTVRRGVCSACGVSAWSEFQDDGETYENRDFDHEAAILRDFF